jgi:hypothetical protein
MPRRKTGSAFSVEGGFKYNTGQPDGLDARPLHAFFPAALKEKGSRLQDGCPFFVSLKNFA